MSRTNSEIQIRQDICDIGKRMYMSGFVAANDGNISVRMDNDEIIATPTGVSKGFMTPEMLCKIDINGKLISGDIKPSSELKMHLRIYQEDSRVRAVTHSHSPYAASFAITRIPMNKAILPEVIVNLGNIPIAKYATPGTVELSEAVAEFVKDYNCALLANHGSVTWGSDLTQAYFRMETLEHYAKILLITKQLGDARELSSGDIEGLIQIREKLGITKGGMP